MSRVMILSFDHEPLTVISIRPSEWKEIEADRLHRWRFLVPRSFAEWIALEDQYGVILRDETTTLKTVWIKFHAVHRAIEPRPDPWEPQSERLFWYGVPEDEELALLLRAAFLPGQVTELQRQKALAYVQGVIAGRF